MARYTRIPLAERFWPKVYFDTTEGGCWLWAAACFSTGYGFLRWFSEETGKWTARGAHRVSWELANGPIPDGLWVLHRCDVKSCVNPAHLFLGTPRDNHYDAMAKGRHVRGETHGRARFTAAQVIDVRRRYAAGGITQQALADEHGVVRSTISWIVHGLHWRHLAAE